MRDANPARNPQGGLKEASFANPQSSAPQSGKSHRQATLIQEALDLACEQLLDEIRIKVMLEKDPVGWKAYSPLTDEERRLYNAMVSPPINPHPFVSDVFEQAGVTHLSSAGGTPTLFYPASTTLPAEGGMEACPPLFYQEGQGLRWGLPLSLPTKRGRKMQTRPLRTGRLTHGWGGCFPLHCH
jgi:hypothetical protein